MKNEIDQLCEHDKVYSNVVLCTYPAQHPWICSKCGEMGTNSDIISSNNYNELVEKFRK